MASPHSLRRLANLTKKVHEDLRKGGMGMTFKYLFRSTAILARVTAILADHVATQAGAPPQAGWEPPGGRGLQVEGDGQDASAERPPRRRQATGTQDG
jgi:hypothetical protein